MHTCDHHEHHDAHQDHSQDHSKIKRLRWVLLMTAGYMIAEVVGGLLSGSLALLADAGHMLADVGAIGLALFAAWFSQQSASPQKTYGYHRIEILTAFINGLALTGVALFIIIEACQRLSNPAPVEGELMLGVAAGGLIVNAVAAWILHGGKNEHQDLNVKAAYLHVLSDLLGSVGAVLAGLSVVLWGWVQADAWMGIAIALLVLLNAGQLLMETVNILLESSPAHINVTQVKEAMLGVEGVLSVHDLHVWSISSGKDALSAHVTVEEAAFHHNTLNRLQHCLKKNFGLSHLTLQLEPPGFEEDEIHF